MGLKKDIHVGLAVRHCAAELWKLVSVDLVCHTMTMSLSSCFLTEFLPLNDKRKSSANHT
jgi:hypothetical protein